MTLVRIFFLITLVCLPCYSIAGAAKLLEQNFATAMVLTNGESVSLGYGHFSSPAALFDDDSQSGNELRQDLNVFNVPFGIKTTSPEIFKEYNSELHLQGSYIDQKNSLNLFNQESADSFEESIYGFGANWIFERPISSKWWFGFGARLQGFRYYNDYDYNSQLSRQVLAPALDGSVVNISANALVASPHVEMMYRLPRHWGYYEYKTSYSYYYGTTLVEPSALGKIRPEGWRYQNGIKARFDTAHIGEFTQAIYIKAHRVDLGGDSASSFATNHFYEYGVGVLLDTSTWSSWLENIGIGLNYHHGSALEGGSIVLYFNE
ncbi:Solitary outer membrane autotransporter beta-barrel domain [Pseudoalteromonas sp. T1lg75]|uniref:Solitary outer membrane autotransporter beta-barrel domain n=1 Tax=Pseudoalteromonas sp. T1lg75 TaxID=2077102 RepID=UPI000CF5F20A|nr:Solitary outer membrane autotransporter beta-barrel domain [Pseudoalteromonas sp. T1lg75]